MCFLVQHNKKKLIKKINSECPDNWRRKLKFHKGELSDRCPKCEGCICPTCVSHNIFLDKEKTEKIPLSDFCEHAKMKKYAYECKDCNRTWIRSNLIFIYPSTAFDEKHKCYNEIVWDNERCPRCGQELCPTCGSNNVFWNKEKTLENPVLDMGEFHIYQDQEYECKNCNQTWSVRK